MTKFDLKKFIAENKATFYSSLSEENENVITKKEALEYAESFEDEDILKDFNQSFADKEDITKQEFFDFFEQHIDDMSEIKYIRAAWRQLSSGEGLYEDNPSPNPEADEIDLEDLEAAADYYDNMKESKLTKSSLRAKIKEMVLAEMNLNITDETPESEEDFLAEVDAILAEADEFETAKPARITSFLKALDLLVYDEYHAELYDSDEVKQAYDLLVKAAKKLGNLNEAEEEVAVDDTEVAVDGEENIDTTTTTEVDPDVKAVQDALTQAQAAAQKLGDPKLTDQIGNTITFFTRTHVVEKGAVAEDLN